MRPGPNCYMTELLASKRFRGVHALSLLFLALFVVPVRALVTTTADSGPGSLRQAVADAQPGEIIKFSTRLSRLTILLTNGQLMVDKSLGIDASTLPDGITLDATGSSRILFLVPAVSPYTVTLNSLTFTRGSAGGGAGGAIRTGTNTTLVVQRCTFNDNHADAGSGDGGAVSSDGQIVVDNCTFTHNSAADRGGALRIVKGGAILRHVTISGNEAYQGGGIYHDAGALLATNSIVAGNSASFSGPDLLNSAPATFMNCLTNGNPMILPLRDHGGPTWTMPPMAGSPAIDAGDNSITNTFAIDQRGFDRPHGVAVDIGAVEYSFQYLLRIVSSRDLFVTLSWPVEASDYFLEYTTKLGQEAIWDLVFDLPRREGDLFWVRTEILPETTQYYRLSK